MRKTKKKVAKKKVAKKPVAEAPELFDTGKDEKPKRRQVRITRRNWLRAYELAKENRDVLRFKTAREAAEFLSAGIGVPMADHSAREACKEAGVELQQRTNSGPNQYTLRRNLRDLASAVEALYKRVGCIEAAWGDKACQSTEDDERHLDEVKSIARLGVKREEEDDADDRD